MYMRTMVVIVLLVVTVAVESPHRSFATEPPRCIDPETEEVYQATAWLDAPGTLRGTARRDVLVGSPGADSIFGGGGNDVICVAPLVGFDSGLNHVEGGAGNDHIFGAGGLQDDFFGGAGDDVMRGYGLLDGGSGNDKLLGSITLRGGSGDDYLKGSGLVLLLDGGSGNDQVGYSSVMRVERIDGGSGHDVCRSGAILVVRCEVIR